MITGEQSIHIAQVIGDFGQGGDGRLARNLALALSRRGVRATCVSVRRIESKSKPSDEVDVIDLGVDHGLVGRLRGVIRLRRWVRHEKSDLIHVHGPQSLVFVVLGLKGLAHQPKLWFTWHDSGAAIANETLKPSVLWAMRQCQAVYGSSNQVVEWLNARQQEAGKFVTRPAVFLNAVPVCPVSPHVSDDCPTLVWAARWVPQKDPQILIRAVATLRDEGLKFKLILAGAGYPHLKWFEDQTRDLVAELNLADCIEMPGWVDDMTGVYQRAAIGVQTSHTEGLSMTLLEQMMAGLAIIATDVGDTTTAIEHEKNGLLIRPNDPIALVSALRWLITDVSRRIRLGDAVRSCAIERFSLNAMADRVLTELRQSDPERRNVDGSVQV